MAAPPRWSWFFVSILLEGGFGGSSPEVLNMQRSAQLKSSFVGSSFSTKKPSYWAGFLPLSGEFVIGRVFPSDL